MILQTTKEIINNAVKIHQNKYDYSEVVYLNSKTKIKIICRIHGIFEQLAKDHLRGHGCVKCAGIKRGKNCSSSKQEFIKTANEIHENKYDYSLVNYINNKTKIEIVCKNHGAFWQRPDTHLWKKAGCLSCSNDRTSLRLKTTLTEFINESMKIHQNKFDYSLVQYKGSDVKVEIICQICKKTFKQTPHAHLFGQGCGFCSGTAKLTNSSFIQKAIEIHKNLFDYSKINYIGNKIKVEIICKKCNKSFQQKPNNHLNGQGCPFCINRISKPEIKWLDNLNILEKYRQYPIKINNKTCVVDGFCSKTNTIYEFFGDYWHGNPEKYNLNKTNEVAKTTFGELYQETMNRIKLFEENGYKVVYIWESDYKLSEGKINDKNNK